MLARADQMIESVQQALKDQGFYYGEITGQTNANLTAAIRRYQIRNGLQVNGELNSETLQSLGINSSASAQPAAKSRGAQPRRTQAWGNNLPFEETNDDASTGSAFPKCAARSTSVSLQPHAPQILLRTGALARTPFETAPPDVQRNVIVSAQIALARRGLYHEDVNGVYGPAMEFSLRAYQARAKLPVTGRLDLQTLRRPSLVTAAARTILRSAHADVGVVRPATPARGEWVPE